MALVIRTAHRATLTLSAYHFVLSIFQVPRPMLDREALAGYSRSHNIRTAAARPYFVRLITSW